MSLDEKIIAFKVSGEEYTMLSGLAQMLHDNKKLPKPSVNALAKSFTFVVTNQFIQIQNNAGVQNG
jgi:ABC-type spermidine/putrescine transport system permease subunit II